MAKEFSIILIFLGLLFFGCISTPDTTNQTETEVDINQTEVNLNQSDSNKTPTNFSLDSYNFCEKINEKDEVRYEDTLSPVASHLGTIEPFILWLGQQECVNNVEVYPYLVKTLTPIQEIKADFIFEDGVQTLVLDVSMSDPIAISSLHSVYPQKPPAEDSISIRDSNNPRAHIEITGVVLPVDTQEEAYQIAIQVFTGINWDKSSANELDYSWSISKLCDLFRPQECTYTRLSIDKETGDILGLAIQ